MTGRVKAKSDSPEEIILSARLRNSANCSMFSKVSAIIRSRPSNARSSAMKSSAFPASCPVSARRSRMVASRPSETDPGAARAVRIKSRSPIRCALACRSMSASRLLSSTSSAIFIWRQASLADMPAIPTSRRLSVSNTPNSRFRRVMDISAGMIECARRPLGGVGFCYRVEPILPRR